MLQQRHHLFDSLMKDTPKRNASRGPTQMELTLTYEQNKPCKAK